MGERRVVAVRFEWDPDAEREIVDQVVRSMQQEIDAVYHRHQGDPEGIVKDALVARLTTALVEPTLSTVAAAIGRGDRVELTL
ncbi:hypothetical protein [Rhodococcus rhodnii]|uniref:hypothetical protein n=1 Tax=Rhodococcus rhodnii TaxID=38312 RepID=UPI00116038ED|nr:hypothetical protein [Rhodococcus rhodnii]